MTPDLTSACDLCGGSAESAERPARGEGGRHDGRTGLGPAVPLGGEHHQLRRLLQRLLRGGEWIEERRDQGGSMRWVCKVRRSLG